MKGDTEDDGEDDVEGITRLDFIPEAPLDEGTYTIEVRATDTIGNSATQQRVVSRLTSTLPRSGYHDVVATE